ncbi:DEAD/DEAH box helicase family protein [Clostridium sp.]|uniref:DEAD/DEAH box helicase family protein n=1 Tax=Clostridium sp. TaxID=1506 RepID=UPI0025BADBA8|nr:DEAD/DEAH box helicase family protein [Clostridium sp.]
MNKLKKYVSDVISVDIVKTLEKGKNYLIGSEMGSGKNYWCRNILLPYTLDNNKKTLILSHRKINRDQQNRYLEEYKWECIRRFQGGMFELITYQQLENRIKRKDYEWLNQFEYIVADEAHYFTKDSSINSKTILSFDWLNNNENAVKILMTGTYESLFYLPFDSKIEVLKEADYYNNNVESLLRYEERETALSVVEERVKKKEKVLIFHNNKEKLAEFDSMLTCPSQMLHSDNKADSEEYDLIVNNQKFYCSVLNTTSLMTEGAEIFDDKVKTIIIDGISELDKFVQAPARVRDGKVNVFYKRVTPRQIMYKVKSLEKQLFYYDEFERLGEIEFVKEYGIDVIGKSMKAFYLDTVIDSLSGQEYTKLDIHTTNLANMQYQLDCYNEMLEYGFEAMLKKYYPNIAYVDYEELKRQEYIKADIIDNYIGKKIFKEDQQILINVIAEKFGLRAKNGTKKLGLKTINGYFEDNKIPYVLDSNKESSGLMRNKQYWLLKKIS